MLKPSIDEVALSTANEFAIQLIFELAEYYKITLEKVFEILSEMNYWRVINDTDVCCELAHDGIQATLHDIGVNLMQYYHGTPENIVYLDLSFSIFCGIIIGKE